MQLYTVYTYTEVIYRRVKNQAAISSNPAAHTAPKKNPAPPMDFSLKEDQTIVINIGNVRWNFTQF
jgi:hypothetical protein